MSNHANNINSRQLSVRLKSFLASADLSDSPTARSLYAGFLQLNNILNERLINCSALLQSQQKIEAVTLAQQEPSVVKMVDAVIFPERKVLIKLAGLYGWEAPAEIDLKQVNEIKKALSEMDDLRPLLAEFRRIARSNQLENKLKLLREISRRDKNNPEWELPLREVENQYLSKLIEQAQQAIINREYEELEIIHEEMTGSTWIVSIPAVVLQKIEKVVGEYREELCKQQAQQFLTGVNEALGAFDITALEDAIICWNDHCSTTGYEPDKNELVQIREAEDFLRKEKEKIQLQQDFNNGITELTGLLDENAPLTDVDRCFNALKATELDIPLHLTRRVEQYREDCERDIRNKFILKVCRIVAVSAVVIVVIVGGARWIFQSVTENRLIDNLKAKTAQKDLAGAKSLLAEIEKKYPSLAKGAKLAELRAEINRLEQNDIERKKLLEKRFAEVEALKKVWPPSDELFGKITEIGKLVREDVEKQRHQALQEWYKSVVKRYSIECENLFYTRINALKELQNNIINLIDEHKFDRAEAELKKLRQLVEDIRKIKFLKPELLAEHQKLLRCEIDLDEMLAVKRSMKNELDDALKKMLAAATFNELEDALRNYVEAYKRNNGDRQPQLFDVLKNDLESLKVILSLQDNGSNTSSINNAYVRDIREMRRNRQKSEQACAALRSTFSRLSRDVDRQGWLFIRFRDNNSNHIDLLINPRSISHVNDEYSLQRDDGKTVTIQKTPGGFRKYRVDVGGKVFNSCALIYPKNINDLRRSEAVHQILIKKIARDVSSLTPDNVISKAVGYLKMIDSEGEFCVEYWKMQLMIQILEAIVPLETPPFRTFAPLLEELKKFRASDNSENPVYNSGLAGRLRKFFASCNINDLIRIGRQIETRNKLFRTLCSTRYQFFGICVNVNGVIRRSEVPATLRSTPGDILCFDAEANQCYLVGRYSASAVIIDEAFRDKIVGRLLFTTSPAGNMAERTRILNQESREQNQIIQWPEFWPMNLKGNRK